MRSLNRTELIGRLGADPEIRRTQAGDAVATLAIATNEHWTDKATGEKREETEWHRCVIWRRLAEIAEQYLHKGARVYVAGQLKTRKWQDRNGLDRYTTEIQVRDMIMLSGHDESGQQHGSQGRHGQQRGGQGGYDQQRGAPVADTFQSEAPNFDDDVPF